TKILRGEKLRRRFRQEEPSERGSKPTEPPRKDILQAVELPPAVVQPGWPCLPPCKQDGNYGGAGWSGVHVLTSRSHP
ncbi:RIKEN cDNA 4930556L07, isoform CRA_c, partial [Mus musculus]